jgi:hypothetical protein
VKRKDTKVNHHLPHLLPIQAAIKVVQ